MCVIKKIITIIIIKRSSGHVLRRSAFVILFPTPSVSLSLKISLTVLSSSPGHCNGESGGDWLEDSVHSAGLYYGCNSSTHNHHWRLSIPQRTSFAVFSLDLYFTISLSFFVSAFSFSQYAESSCYSYSVHVLSDLLIIIFCMFQCTMYMSIFFKEITCLLVMILRLLHSFTKIQNSHCINILTF